MRFKARVQRQQFPQLHTYIKTLSELGAKHALLYLAKEFVRSIVKTDDDALILWASLKTDATFSAFSIESKANNVIGLEVALPNLLHALKAGPSAEWVQLKLSKRGPVPYLCVEAQTVEGGVTVVQDVPVRVLSAADLSRYSEPAVPNPLIRMVLPHPRSMQAVVDRMRATGGPSLKHLILHADARKREVCLSIATAEVSIRTFYRGVMRDDGGDGSSQSQEGAVVTVAVPIRDYGRILRAVANMSTAAAGAGGSNVGNALLFICPGSALVVHAPLPRALGAGDAVVGGGDDDDGAVGAMTFILSTADPSSETLGAS